MSSTIPLPPREQLCNRYCSDKHTLSLKLIPPHIKEYACGSLLERGPQKLAKDSGGIRPIICGESWRRCFASLAANDVRGPISRIFTSPYDQKLQTAGLQDGASHCAKILSSMYAALNSDPCDPDVIIKLDISTLSTRCAAC